jgi:hypothetical protein
MDNVQNLAQAICDALGNGWHTSPPNPDAIYDRQSYLIGSDGAQLDISSTWAGNHKLYIAGSEWGVVPKSDKVPYGIKMPSIQVSDTKTPEQIAKDIKRRLLPEYAQVLATLKQKYQEQVDYASALVASKEEVLAIAGGSKHKREYESEVQYRFNGPSIEVTSPDSIRVTYLYLTVDQYRRMKEAIPELWKRGDE